MNLTSARDAKLALKELSKEALGARAPRRGLSKLETIRAGAMATPLFAIGIAPKTRPGRKRPDFHLAIRVYAGSEAAARTVINKLFKKNPAMQAESHVVYGVRPEPRGKTLQSGTSGAHFEVGAGTMGAFVANSADVYILSCNHVFAKSDGGRIDDPIVHPSPNDSADVDVVGRLSDWVSLGKGTVDAAIARISDTASHYRPCFYSGIGSTPPEIVDDLREVQDVIKLGQASNITTGTISSYELDGIVMDYGGGLSVVFDDQIEIEGSNGRPFSAKGDSGAVVLDNATNRPYALLFGGGIGDDNVDRTWAHFLPPVFSELGVFLAT